MDEVFKSGIRKLRLHNDLFEQLILKNSDNPEQVGFLREKATKSFIIDIYTFWESTIKKKVFDTLEKNSNILLSEAFISNYSKDVLSGNSFVKELYVKSFREKKLFISEKILCNSNNLGYESLFKLVSKIFLGTSKEELKLFLMNNNGLDKTITKLKDTGVAKADSSFDAEGYLNAIVNQRNSISHSYEEGLRYNKEQRDALLCFIEKLINSLFIFIESKIISKKIELNHNHRYLSVDIIIKCNKLDDYGILCIDFEGFSGDQKPLENDYYIEYVLNVEKDGNDYPLKFYEKIDIKGIKNERKNTCKIFPNSGKRTISFCSNIILRKTNDYQIVNFLETNKKEKFELDVVIEIEGNVMEIEVS